MSKIYKIILIVFTALFFNNANASHMMGGDISYECISPGKYKITLKVYRDCTGIPFNSPDITMFCEDGSNNTALSYQRVAINDISPTCSSGTGPCSPQNQSAGKGIEEHVFEAMVDFNVSPFKKLKDNCCKIKLQVNQCCRNGAITTINAGNFYTDAMIDLCNIAKTTKKCNTAPQLSIPPVAYLCCNQPFTFNNGVRENVDGDSLSYDLGNPLNNNNSNESYTGSFSAKIPMTPFCPPKPGVINCRPLPGAKPPRGFYFDEETGDIIFTPTKCDEVGIIVIQVTEWRKDSATRKWIQIGYTRRDMQLIVTQCPDNNPPYFVGTNKHSVCAGEKICFTIKSKDDPFLPNQTRPDTTQLTWNFGIPGATFTITNPTDREKEAEFCWATKYSDARPNPYTFTAIAKDDACPKPAQAVKGYNVTVVPRAESTRKYTLLECGKLRFEAFPVDTVNFEKKNYRYKFSIRDSTNSGRIYKFSTSKKDSFKFQYGGKYIIEHEINNPPYNCPLTYTDTVIIPPVLDVQLAFDRDTFVCAGQSIDLIPIIANGIPKYKYQWEVPTGTVNSSDTFNKIKITPTKDTKITLRLTDKNKCVDYDTILIKYIKNPVVNIGPDQRICTYDMVTLDAENADSLMYIWNTGDLSRTIDVNIAGKYFVRVQDSIYKCFATDTMNLFVNDTVIAIAKPDREICINDTLKVTGKRKPLGFSRQIIWRDLNTGTIAANDSAFKVKIITAATRNYEMHLRVTQGGVTCENKDTFNLIVNPLPIFSGFTIPPHCFEEGPVNLTLFSGLKVTETKSNTVVDPSKVKFYQNKVPSWVTGGPITVNTYVWDYPKFVRNDQVPRTGLTDIICYEYKDINGCVNKECKNVKLSPNPTVELKTGTFCQKAGLITLDKLIVAPTLRVGSFQSFKCINVPAGSGVDKDAIVWEDNTNYPPTFVMDPGQEGENQKTGEYEIEYCFRDVVSGCSKCDSIMISVVKLPEIQFSPLPKQCVNYPLLELDSFVTDLSTGKRMLEGVWSTVEFRNSRDMSNSLIANGINNSTVGGKQFRPSHANPLAQGAGQYLLKFYDKSSGCVVQDSTEIVVNSLPFLRINLPPIVCSSLAPFDLLNEQPTGNEGKWSGFGVTGRSFDPSASPKTKQTEGPYRMKFEYTHPLTSCTDSIFGVISVQSQPEAKISTPKPYQQCEGIPFTLAATKEWATTTTWSTSGDGSFNDKTQLNAIYTHGLQDTAINGSNGQLMLTITTDAEGVCPPAKDEIPLIIEPFPQFSMPHHFVQCEAATIDFTSTIQKPLNSSNLLYTWSFGHGDTLKNSPLGSVQKVYDSAKQGWYDVSLSVINQWGAGAGQQCVTKKDSLDYVRVLPQPKAGFSSDPSFFTTVAFPKFKFTNETKYRWGAEDMSYVWSFDINDLDDTSTQINPVKTYRNDTTTYWVNLLSRYTYSAANDITIDEDVVCEDSISQIRKIGPDVTVFVPTAFSPERTGPKSNNVFLPVVNGEKSYYVMVFNRWGEIIWDSYDKHESWNGTYKGQDAQQDVYVWHVKVTAYDGEQYEYEGTVTLLR